MADKRRRKSAIDPTVAELLATDRRSERTQVADPPVEPEPSQASIPASQHTSKPAYQQASIPANGDKIKKTYYFTEDTLYNLDAARLKLRRMVGRPQQAKVSNSSIIELALKSALADLERAGPDSRLAQAVRNL
jgi:hypothetical protein